MKLHWVLQSHTEGTQTHQTYF